MSRLALLFLQLLIATTSVGHAQPSASTPGFVAYLQSERRALVAFNPSRYDARTPAAGAYPNGELRADPAALRPAFDGLILYGYDAALSPGILDQAAALGYRAAAARHLGSQI